MRILNLDLFSSEFYFNLDGPYYKKGTIQGVLLSFSSVILVLSYFFYLLHQYLNNFIDPQFRSQSFISSSSHGVQLDQDLIGFFYYYNTSLTVEQYQIIQNKTYLVYYPYFYYQDPINNIYQTINLNITQCTSPQLQGFSCIDFSQISNYTLILDNISNILSSLYINVYGCLDLDDIKTTIPDNCATQSEIDNVINGDASGILLKLKTQQYNTTSKEIQTNYRSMQIYSLQNQFILSSMKTQIQDTEVKQGFLLQSQQYYSSPIYYETTMYSFDRNVSLQAGVGPYNQINIFIDEIVQYTQIKYPTITEILALVNSVAAIIMIIRFLGRMVSQKLIKEDFFILILRNLFQQKCQEILQINNLINKSGTLMQVQSRSEEEASQNRQQELVVDAEEKDNKTNFLLPNFESKYLQKRVNSNFNLDNSSQKNRLFFDEEKDQNEQFRKNNSMIQSSTSPSTNQVKLQVLGNLLNFDKIDTVFQNESLITQQMDCRTQTLQKKDSVSQIQFLNNKLDRPKSNFKDKLKGQVNKNDKNLSEAISQKLSIMQSKSIKESLQNIIFKFKCFRSKNFLQSKGLKQKQLDKIREEVLKSLNIYEFFKDITFLKKAISMLLSSDQIAALQFVGLTEDLLNLDLKRKDLRVIYEQEKKKLNHFERQYLILQYEELQVNYIERFLVKCQEGSDLTEVDKRIISSINQNK
ncbi:AMP-binding enzyme family protein (macronuclear) [Tetrahymena thermophila SB210]|uniref:AMP-binding enzyme family protein n=1 Tax=Tetrahymena thermophila (strain SB210) TaxID=312017 RepID=Q23JF1_TETTS|nr:AMP-binding enzyme family protein [Tetrahymena thermophila SB210]EAR96553.2 AMP-binding enzyme family protein [Tetrahymena thermophila SB210]|eukprot:XP_001016798.2 AMP-binding enzyme family protein [Tetrahymena thermophila SB210]